MRSYVRYAAAAAASLLVFSACGGDTDAPASPDLSSGSLNYTITPAVTGWTKLPEDPLPVDTRTVLIGGLIAVGGYPQFGAMQYSGASNWLEMTTTPDLSRSPLAWRFTFKLKPQAASLPIGSYQAVIPVTVGGAQNNPQQIVITYSNCGNCLFVGDVRDGELTVTDPVWDRSSTYNEGPGDYESYPYDDWRVFVPAFTTVAVLLQGEDCLGNPYTHEDPYLYAWTPAPDLDFITSDDDGDCGNDSIIYITNNTGAQREYLVRATSFGEIGDGRDFGSYRISVFLDDDDYDYDLRAPEPGDKPTAERSTLLRATPKK
jgi:hypothetical protein